MKTLLHETSYRGSGIKKWLGGGVATKHRCMHSAMFDSARVRVVLRCYDTIDRVLELAIIFLVKSSLLE